jgi:hypothetical protein
MVDETNPTFVALLQKAALPRAQFWYSKVHTVMTMRIALITRQVCHTDKLERLDADVHASPKSICGFQRL